MRLLRFQKVYGLQCEMIQVDEDLHPVTISYSEKAMAPHSSTLAWRIPWTEEPSGLQSMGVGEDS